MNKETKNKKEIYKLYNGKITLVFDPETHTYTIGNQIIYGSTGIIGVLDKPGLVGWALNCAVRSADKDISQGTPKDTTLKNLKKASWLESLHAREVGDRVHEFVANYFRNPKDKNSLMMEALQIKDNEERNSIKAFLDFIGKHKIEKDFVERKIYSKKYNYAGTVDFAGTVDGEYTIIDWKTSSAIYPSYFLQTASYAQALTEEFPDKEIVKTRIVRLGKDGKLEEEAHTNWQEDLPIFLHLLGVYVWMQKIKDKENS